LTADKTKRMMLGKAIWNGNYRVMTLKQGQKLNANEEQANRQKC
jgi:hypothetical protein